MCSGRFRVKGVGLGEQGWGGRDQGFGLRFQGVGFGVWGLGAPGCERRGRLGACQGFEGVVVEGASSSWKVLESDTRVYEPQIRDRLGTTARVQGNLTCAPAWASA